MSVINPKIFFGRRKGKPLRAAQSGLMETLLPHFSPNLYAPYDAESLFGFTPERVVLEIGFGGGEHLVHHAKLFPNTGFMGAEAFETGMAKILGQIEAENTQNIRLHYAEAESLLAWLPNASLDQIDLFYPDPWPKTRHHKRRFVSDKKLVELSRVLKPQGIFRFATDIENYVEWTLERILRSPHFTWAVESQEDWQKPYATWTKTRYERKALAEGRKATYLTFINESPHTPL
jgi:tRNA (guanine-N7-)-methyltransferase